MCVRVGRISPATLGDLEPFYCVTLTACLGWLLAIGKTCSPGWVARCVGPPPGDKKAKAYRRCGTEEGMEG